MATTSSRRPRSPALLSLLLLLVLAFSLLAASAVPMTPTAPHHPHPHHEHRHPLTNTTYAVGLSATGFLLPFLQGALEALVETGVVQPAQTPVAGSSGGAMLALAACSGASVDAVHAALEALAERCRPRACAFTQDDAVREALGRIMDAAGGQGAKDVAAQRCRGKAFAAVSVAFGGRDGRSGLFGELRRHCGGGGGGPTSDRFSCALRALHTWWWRPGLWVVGDWRDRQDLEDGVAASAFFPVLSSAARPFASLRGRSRLLDGVYASPLPLPPLADNSRPVRVSAVPLGTSAAPFSKPILEAEIAPFLRVSGGDDGALPEGLPTERAWRRFLLLVPSEGERRAMRELGRREALAWWSEEVVVMGRRRDEAKVAAS